MKPNTQTAIILGASVSLALLVLFVQGYIIPKQDESIISQNDMYCATTWKIRLTAPIEHTLLDTVLRNKIAELSPVYDIPDREIKIEDIGNDRIKITISGVWWLGQGVPDLGSSIASIDFVKEVENSGIPVESWCR